ncbi:TerC family protein [Consotaella aegiceratis]|uniref:TerC family protein n=1 Tax=Consotaella aegiceratis TaxID=3097961 RepID=UPI002F3EDC83
MSAFVSPDAFAAFLRVVFIDISLAGDNAIVIALAASGLMPELRSRAIVFGTLAAAVLRIVFALAAVQLLDVTGLSLIGGVILLWVCWKLWGELRDGQGLSAGCDVAVPGPSGKSLHQAVWQIVVADVSMSLDNVLAVAGGARHHDEVLVFGLVMSVALMAMAASLISNLLHRFRWIGIIGLLVILYVAFEMIVTGAEDVLHTL